MKKIVTVSTFSIITIKAGKKNYNIIDKSLYNWHYAEVKPREIKMITSYNEVIKAKYLLECPSTTNREKRKYGDGYAIVWDRVSERYRKISAANFVSYAIEEEYIEQNHYTLQDLMKNLSADELIEYLKDNGLNVCPIAR